MAGSDALPLTGERTVPGIASENYWFRRHEAAYLFAADIARGARVLEVGCGEGYGTALIASSAATILGVDYDAATIAHAARRYADVPFVRANLAALPVGDALVDVVMNLQVIEHVWDHTGFVAECRRVVRPGGAVLVTTPNRLTFSPGRAEPVNPFHTKEFTADELTALLRAGGFGIEFVGGLHGTAALAALDRAHDGSLVTAQLAQDPATWSTRLRTDVAAIGTRHFAVLSAAERDVDASLDLVVLATRPDTSGAAAARSAP